MKFPSFSILFCLTMASSFASAQQTEKNETPVLAIGEKYEVFGWSGQTRFTHDVVIESANGQEVKGYAISVVGVPSCVGEVVPILGKINQDGSMILTAKQQGGCGSRSWTIKKPAQGDKIEAVLIASVGRFSVTFVPKITK